MLLVVQLDGCATLCPSEKYMLPPLHKGALGLILLSHQAQRQKEKMQTGSGPLVQLAVSVLNQ